MGNGPHSHYAQCISDKNEGRKPHARSVWRVGPRSTVRKKLAGNMGPVDAELMLREQPAIEEVKSPAQAKTKREDSPGNDINDMSSSSASCLKSNRAHGDKSISTEETKFIAQGILAIASDIKDKKFDKNIADKLLRGDRATLIGALVAGVNNTAVAEHMTTSDTATIKETLANIGELDAVELDQERFKEDNPDEVTDNTETLTEHVDGSTTAAPLAVRHEMKQFAEEAIVELMSRGGTEVREKFKVSMRNFTKRAIEIVES
ncbi:hypothetical protein N7523_004058 [Penicillium sp. IBT 18751x]|nr:hypothetical protein N7523_004058 [Penicillium sp. IBT 18751x]